MKNITVHNYNINANLKKEITICHISDCHLTEYDKFSTKEEIDFANQQTLHWQKMRHSFATGYKESFGGDAAIPACVHLDNLLKVSEKSDCLVFTGDMFDYMSGANIRALEGRINKLKKPFIYVCGNHEIPSQFPDDLSISVIKQELQIVDLGEVIIVGFDNSKREITPSVLNRIKQLQKGDKKLIIAMHVPIVVEGNTLHQQTSEYFKFNYPNCPQINLDFVNFIKESKNIIALLCGHLHFSNNVDISQHTRQFVASQGVAGHINVYNLK